MSQEIIDILLYVTVGVAAFSGIIFELYFFAFPYSENIKKSGGRLNLRLSGSGFWGAKRKVKEYIEPERQSQAWVLYLISRNSFICVLLLFLLSIMFHNI